METLNKNKMQTTLFKTEKNTKEIWKNIPEFPNYKISTLGRLVRIKNNNNKIVKCSKKSKYRRACLFNKTSYKNYRISQIMAIVFLNHKPNGNKMVVDHIDNNQKNDKLNNIQIISHRQNSSKEKKGISKYTGVSQQNKSGWKAEISINKRKKYLGSFKTEIEASKVYQEALNNHLKSEKI